MNLELISRCTIFGGLGRDALELILGLSNLERYSADQTIFSEGDSADEIHLLASGMVDMVKTSPAGREQFLRRVKPGEMFAEAAAFAGEAYPASAISRTKSEVVKIDKEKFIQFLRSHPDVSLKMMGAMARLLRHLNNLLSEHTLGSVKSRLAAFLLDRAKKADSTTFDLGIEKKELAYKLGTIPETLSRNFASFKQTGAIWVQGSQIKIKDRKKLEQMVQG